MVTTNDLLHVVKREGYLWGDEVADTYHENAERSMPKQWENVIWPFLNEMDIDYSCIVDFACGRCRNSIKLLEKNPERLTVMDVNEQNIEFCRQRFAENSTVEYALCDGRSLSELPDSTVSFFYCFDAMVHFDIEIVLSYIKELKRVLKPKGHAFLHHSNYMDSPGTSFRKNPHWRNFNSREIVAHFAVKNQLKVIAQKTFDWAEVKDLDCLTMLQRY